jgi:hypothetical protein
LDFFKAMRAEHVTKGGHDLVFVTGNYKLQTQAFLEWMYVAGDENGKRLELPSSAMGDSRVILPIDDLLQKPAAKAANLTREEVIAIVMYTGPAFKLYNAVLRRVPAEIYEVFKSADNLFPTTIFVLVSAINKLSRCASIPRNTMLYRGLGGSTFPERFSRPDPDCKTPNALGYLEYGFMSTTADKSIAVKYSGVAQGRQKACVLQIRPNAVDRGADISEFSQYPAEKEYLFVPYSFVQGEGRQRAEVAAGGGVLTVVPVHVNINLKTETVDELKEKKKRLHIASARAVRDELRYELEQWAQSREASERLLQDPTREQGGTFTSATLAAAIVEQCGDVVNRHNSLSAEEYVDDGDFRALVGELLDTKAWAKEKFQLWLRDDSQFIRFLQRMSLRDCHRLWLVYIRKCIAGAAVRFFDHRTASVELLKSRGLVRKGVTGEANVDGEDVLVYAGADGWSAVEISAAVAAGADIGAVDRVNGANGLMKSARYGHLESLNALVVARCDIDQRDMNGATAIYSAARAGNADCVKALLSAQANLHTCNADGCSPLHAAAGNGHAQCLKLLLEAKGSVTTSSNFGESPILIATRRGWRECVALLLEAKSDPNQRDNRGCSPVCMAAFRNRIECLSLLIDARADIASLWEGKTALEVAQREGHVDCARLIETAMK